MRHADTFANRTLIRTSERLVCGVFFLCACVGAFAGCGVRGVERGASACTVLDSLYEESGFEQPVVLEGKATVDANQYRIRGQVRLDSRSPGEIVFEFTSTMLFGNQRQDFLFVLLADTVRIIDREHGAYYEGEGAEEFMSESLEADFRVSSVLPLAFGAHPACDELDDIRFTTGSAGEIVCSGKRFGKRFRVVFGADHSRLKEVEWPIRSETYGVDRLTVTYEWDTIIGGGLREVVMKVEMREWRCKIKAR